MREWKAICVFGAQEMLCEEPSQRKRESSIYADTDCEVLYTNRDVLFQILFKEEIESLRVGTEWHRINIEKVTLKFLNMQ